MADLIDRQAAIDALWKALYEYEDKTEKQFQESEDLDIQDWIQHRIFVQNMSDIDRRTILDLPPVQPKRGKWILNRSGAYCCSECMEPCASYFMMKPRDKFCKMCGAKMERNEDDTD